MAANRKYLKTSGGEKEKEEFEEGEQIQRKR